MFFSIIIPIFNAERSLKQCLDSISRQSFEDYEVLMVDDGSQDNSSVICGGYAGRDFRFKLLQQENRGPSAARNRGLENAGGAYLCFVDSDDTVAPDYLEQLHNKIVDCRPDVIFFGYHGTEITGGIKATFLPPTGLDRAALLVALSERDMFGYTWIKCLSRETVGDTRFPSGMSLFEDEVFTCAVLERANRIEVLPQALYYYVNGGAGTLTEQTHDDYAGLSDRVYSAWKRLMRNVPEGEVFLRRKANVFAGRCLYYGFERDVDMKYFFRDLAGTSFFAEHTSEDRLDQYIRSGSLFMLRWEKTRYRLKCRLKQALNVKG